MKLSAKKIGKPALFLLVLCLTAVIPAQEKPNGLAIIRNVYNRPQPKDQQGKLVMSLINSRSEERVREIQQFLSDDGTVEKKIMFFVSPADVRNTSFMNWSYSKAGKDDDQWIYLPALKKIKRISSEGKSDYFMGSDFTYDDLGDRQPEEDEHTLLREETIDGKACYVVKSISKDPNYMYAHTLSWINKESWIGVKKEFFDEDGARIKTLNVQKTEKVGPYLIITQSEMVSHEKNHRTRMVLSGLVVDTKIADSQFSERTMMRGL